MPLSKTRWIDLPHVADDRGVLTSIESGLDIPFAPRRVFFIRDGAGERGSHAHRATSQLLVCVAGALQVEVSDGSASATQAGAGVQPELVRRSQNELPIFVHQRRQRGASRAQLLERYLDERGVHRPVHVVHVRRGFVDVQ